MGYDELIHAKILADQNNMREFIIRLDNDFGKYYTAINNYDQGEFYYMSAYDKSVELNYKFGKATSAKNIGIMYSELKNWEEARRWLLLALFLSKESKIRQNIGRIYQVLAEVEEGCNQPKNALKWAYKGMDIYERIQDKQMKDLQGLINRLK